MAERSENVVNTLAGRLSDGARASAVFGKAVERKGVTVIPVARARFAFGGGSGSDPRGGGEGGGGGGIATVRPVGYIEVSKGGTTYRPIRDWPRIVGTAAAAAAAAGLVTAAVLRRR